MKRDKVKYIKPKKPHIVIDDIGGFLEKHIEDPRSNDNYFFRTEVKDFMERMEKNYELLRNGSRISQHLVYMLGVQFVTILICQLQLFGRIIISHQDDNLGSQTYGEDLPTLPKGYVPFFMKDYENGKVVDYSDLHTLSVMKKWYNNGKGKDDRLLNQMLKWIEENTIE